MRALGAAVLLMGLASAQSLPSSWDTAGDSAPVELVDGVECIAGELVIGLRDWSDYPALQARIVGMGDTVLGGIPGLRALRVRIASSDAGVMMDRQVRYRTIPYVRYVERNGIFTACGASTVPPPNDTYYPLEWHLNNPGQTGGTPDADVDAPEGWLIASGAASTAVAVIDVGVNLQHPEFQGRLLPGWDFLGEDDNPTGFSHGNWVTGVVAANANNEFEVAGIDLHCMILPVKVGGAFATEFNLAQGIYYAAARQAAIVNISIGAPESFELIHDAVIEAAAAGCIVVAAAGNSKPYGSADKHVPAKYPEVISVGFTDAQDKRAHNSSTGNTLDFVAPGDDIHVVTTAASGLEFVVAGSSVASPLVAGIASIMMGLNPYLTFDQIYDLLRQGAEDQVGDPAEDTPGWDPYYGWGRVNLRRSLEALCGCQGGESLIASPQHASIAASEVVAFKIDAGREHAGQTYWVFGSASGAGAWPLGPLTLPITPDDYTRFTFSDANGSVLVNTHGQLDDAGQAIAFLMLPQRAGPVSAGTLHHIAVVFDGRAAPAHAVLATNVTTTTVEP
jgi:Subtilase family